MTLGLPAKDSEPTGHHDGAIKADMSTVTTLQTPNGTVTSLAIQFVYPGASSWIS